MDKRLYFIAGLGIIAVSLAVYREKGTNPSEQISFSFAAKKEIAPQRLYGMAEATLLSQGVLPKNIRPIKDRNDVRVVYPQTFDVLNFISVLKDSLDGYSAEVFSIDNAKDKSSVVQVKNGDVIIKSFIFNKEQSKAPQKGVVPSVPK
jgi:hypothetical protein